MTLSPGDATAHDTATCHFPGCTRASRPDSATGRPAKYCEEVVDGVRHDRVNAWHRRRADKPAGPADSAVSSAPVSMARATLEERLAAIPEALTQFAELLNGAVAELRTAGDLEAAGAEVEDARREALAQVSEAERRASAADRARREAEARAAAAETERAEADAVAEAAIAENHRARTESEQQLASVRAEASAAVQAAGQQVQAAQEQARQADIEREQQVQAARDELLAARDQATAAEAAREAAEAAAERERQVTAALRTRIEDLRSQCEAARAEAATARAVIAGAEAARDTAQQAAERERAATVETRRELEQVRADARADHQALQTQHAEQLRQLTEAADARAAALGSALDVARGAAETYRAQLAGATASPPASPETHSSSRGRRPQKP